MRTQDSGRPLAGPSEDTAQATRAVVDKAFTVLEAWRRFPVEAPVPLADAVRSGEPVWLESREAWLARYPQLASDVASANGHASAALPLVIRRLQIVPLHQSPK